MNVKIYRPKIIHYIYLSDIKDQFDREYIRERAVQDTANWAYEQDGDFYWKLDLNLDWRDDWYLELKKSLSHAVLSANQFAIYISY